HPWLECCKSNFWCVEHCGNSEVGGWHRYFSRVIAIGSQLGKFENKRNDAWRILATRWKRNNNEWQFHRCLDGGCNENISFVVKSNNHACDCRRSKSFWRVIRSFKHDGRYYPKPRGQLQSIRRNVYSVWVCCGCGQFYRER